MKASAWIDRAKAAKGWESDYRAAKELGITRGAMSQIRIGQSATLGEDTALKVAEALGIDPAGIVIDQLAERSKSPTVRASLRKLAEPLYIMLSKACAIKRIAVRAHAARDMADFSATVPLY